ncbi:hypothetical protein [Microbaculum marinisediminis]|uniref:Uncharacterized protein n=1 Tax=Microbaculum marinisediminis TaxID=2931392 RepID=A0AAW5QTY3_9HYPH|nr:hypothetical protein [Microbaculum sp. A6E488]MCT8970672.1 hypothetical protein [Microbaculum sp. A6E488]
MKRILIAAVVLLVAVPGAYAQGADRPDTEGDRYVLRRVDDGLMRLDRETGDTSFCRKRGGSWVCEAVADDREALEAEINRLVEDNGELAREIGRLKQRIARLEGRDTEPEGDRDGTGPDAKSTEPEVPSDEELDKVFRTFEKVMRRFMDMARDLREDYESQDRF